MDSHRLRNLFSYHPDSRSTTADSDVCVALAAEEDLGVPLVGPDCSGESY